MDIPNRKSLKYFSLVTLSLQNAILAISMRYARTQPGDMFLSSTAVVMSELVKLITCIGFVWVEQGSFKRMLLVLQNTIIKNPIDTLKISVPSIVYIMQNNLLYLAATHLDAATYQVTYQLKILTTALFAVFILRKKLIPIQWTALVMLVSGVVLVQLAQSNVEIKVIMGAAEQNRLIGFAAGLGACMCSGFAGIYFEKMLKGSDVTLWIRNVQLSFLSLPFGLIACFLNDGEKILQQGFFFGYTYFVDYLVILHSCGGLLVAMVVKYADSILKGFASSSAIIISCIASVFWFDFQLTYQCSLGVLMVISSIFLYAYEPKKIEKNN